jgi:hypothetical protein
MFRLAAWQKFYLLLNERNTCGIFRRYFSVIIWENNKKKFKQTLCVILHCCASRIFSKLVTLGSQICVRELKNSTETLHIPNQQVPSKNWKYSNCLLLNEPVLKIFLMSINLVSHIKFVWISFWSFSQIVTENYLQNASHVFFLLRNR